MKELIDSEHKGKIFREGLKVVIAGLPNAGKSSLLNYISGFERAIVSDIEGTTRDFLEEQIHIEGIPIKLIDTAGIRKTKNKVELLGVEKTKKLLETADLIFWILDSSKEFAQQVPDKSLFSPRTPVLFIVNKIDLKKQIFKHRFPTAYISLKRKLGLKELHLKMKKLISNDISLTSDLAINMRHAQLLKKSYKSFSDIKKNIDSEDWELCSINLRMALDYLGEILGKTSSPDLLHSIFSKYCIGK